MLKIYQDDAVLANQIVLIEAANVSTLDQLVY